MGKAVRQRSAARHGGAEAKLLLGPTNVGLRLTSREFDDTNFDEEAGGRYELINGILVVSPMPLPQELDPNDELGFLLRKYQHEHPHGKALDRTLNEHIIHSGDNRRRPDRVLWAVLGRRPHPTNDVPTIVVEFVSEGKRNWIRDYIEKRDEYFALGVKEYWIIDRFDKTMTVFTPGGRRPKRKDLKATQKYATPLLPGFELPLARLFALADDWEA